jgi:hypothetical protein
VRDAVGSQGIEQGVGDVLLPDKIGERLRAPLTIEYLGSHYGYIIPLKIGDYKEKNKSKKKTKSHTKMYQ